MSTSPHSGPQHQGQGHNFDYYYEDEPEDDSKWLQPDDHVDYDHYNDLINDDDEGHYFHPEGMTPFTFNEILEHCIEPTVRDATIHVGKLLFWCLVFRIAANSTSFISKHLISSLTGIVALAHFFHINAVYCVILALTAFFGLVAGKWMGNNRALIVTFSCVMFNVTCELFVVDKAEWHQIRGCQMIMTMKAVSLAFDLDQVNKGEQSQTSDKQVGFYIVTRLNRPRLVFLAFKANWPFIPAIF